MKFNIILLSLFNSIKITGKTNVYYLSNLLFHYIENIGDMLKKNPLMKALYVIMGMVSLGIGILGIFIPGLPTTVFLLFAATMFFHGNKKFHDMLLANKYLGKYIRDFREKRGMTIKQKLISMITMWIMIGISSTMVSRTLAIAIAVFGLIGTLCIFIFVPMYRKEKEEKPDYAPEAIRKN
jgi:uncharacterized membrane protein YbaN (DUF454 family)